MAEELDRVRISAAELRAEASTLITRRENIKDVREDSKRQRQREGKRPDMQRYQPGAGHKRKESVETDDTPQTPTKPDLVTSVDGAMPKQESQTPRPHSNSKPRVHRNSTHQDDDVPSNDHRLLDAEFSNICLESRGTDASGRRCAVKDAQGSDPGLPASPKQSRKARKPDREIYQAGGRRPKGTKDGGSAKDFEQGAVDLEPCGASSEMEKGSREAELGHKDEHRHEWETRDREESRGSGEAQGKARDEKGGRNRRSKDSNRKSEQGRPGKRDGGGGPGPPNEDHGCVDTLAGKVERLSMGDGVGMEREGKEGGEGEGGKKGGEGEGGRNRRRRSGNDGRKSRTSASGAETTSAPTEGAGKKRDRGGRRSKGGERASLFESGKRDSLETEKGRGVEMDPEADTPRQAKGKDPPQQREPLDRSQPRDNRSKKKEGDADRAIGDGDRNRANRTKGGTASKRYSKSDIRRARNRTCSTSSASSITSLDGPLDGDRRRAPAGGGGVRDRGEPGPKGSTTPSSSNRMAAERGNGGRPNTNHRRRQTNRDISSSDSLEDFVWDKGGGSSRRARASDEDWSPAQTPEKAGRGGSRGGSGAGRGGILRVTADRPKGPSHPTLTSGDDQPSRRQSEGPRGRGRGILVLPAHTDLSRSPEPGPKLFGMSKWSRGRGGRGGGTRRLWDPNNPDQKPALVARGQMSQHGAGQHPLYMLPHGGYGPLQFLDTDDEAAGSPPVRKGEHFQGHPASAMAFYKFQNSDNPYCYPVPADASGTPPRYPYPYPVPYSGDMYASPPYYSNYGQGAAGFVTSGAPPLSPEEAEEQARGELGRLLRSALSQELQLSNLLSRDHVSLEGLERMAQLRAELLAMYERVILSDIEFSDSQNLDQALWKNVFYQVIERFRQMMKESPSDTPAYVRNMLFTVLDEGAAFFDALLQKLQTAFVFKLEDYMDGMAIRTRPLKKTVKYALISAQRCMICQGDLARYREQATDSANYGKARSWYLKAQQIAPKNGRPYNQLALLAVYTKRKLDAVYYYMRSLAASNPILTAKESLMGLFEEAKRKADDVERRKQQQQQCEGGSRGLRGRGGGGGGAGGGGGPGGGPGGGGRGSGDATREEIWIRPSRQPGGSWPESESGKDTDLDGELGTLSSRDLQKGFILSFLHTHGKLFTKVGMETFPAVASRVLQEFRVLLQHSPSPLGSTRLLQIITINMFTIHNAQSRDGDGDGDVRSPLQEQATALGLAMFGLLVQRCSQLLREAPTDTVCVEGCEAGSNCTDCAVQKMVRVSAFSADLRELLPSAKVWSDWMLGHPGHWNPPPNCMDSSPSVWGCLAELCNELARVYHGEAALYKVEGEGEGEEEDEELTLLLLEEDLLLAGFVPLLAAPQEPCYIDRSTDKAIAADCKRITQLKYFLEALCGQEEPLLAFKGGKYVSMVKAPTPTSEEQRKESQSDDVIVEAESSQSGSEADLGVAMEAELADGSEDDIKELRARRHALSQKLAQQQKRRDKIQEVLQTCRRLELRIRPVYLVPDTNGFIDHLEGLRSLVACGLYMVVVPLIVITELDGLAKGQQDARDGGAHAQHVQERAREAVSFLERRFSEREPCLRALTSRGSQLDSIAFRSEDISGQKGNNDDVILSCCLHYCKDKPKDLVPAHKDGKVRLRREVVLLTDDRNLRVKALTRNVPVRDIPAFLRWAKVG
ncbi:hypothetical protein ACEWY4_010009 [Coilia grayii]|uniref:Telomerase-binding protein EST1A n=1 Tax=Coilia grayii TaxID=363190 RepID=A0ABD1K815_9TELE